MTDRDRQRLLGVHSDLTRAIADVFDEMEADQTPMFIVCGLRTDDEQRALYAQGRDHEGHVVGRVVTYKDGVTHRSNHQPHADHLGYAVDAAFLGPQPYDARHPWHIYGARLEAHGMRWGGRWSFGDLGHAALSERKTGVPLKA
jgi:hypothetical protein